MRDVSGPEVTLECFNYKGKVYSIARERLLSKAGVCVKARVFHAIELESIAQRFADPIQLPYLFNLQFMRNQEGRPVITDVNLRTAAGMSLSYACGWDEVSALVKVFLNQSEEEVTSTVHGPIQEQFVVREYVDIVTKKVKSRIAFDLDGTLLDEANRHRRVMDVVLKERGWDLDTSSLMSFKQSGRNNVQWLLEQGVGPAEAKEIQKRWIELIEDDKNLPLDVLYPGSFACLERLSRDHSLFLITARKNKEGLMRQIKSLGIYQFFEEVFAVDPTASPAKCKEDVLSANEIQYFIGDTEVDSTASQNAGCQFYTSYWGMRTKSWWEQQGAEFFEWGMGF